MKEKKTNRSEVIGNIMMTTILMLFWAAIVLEIIGKTIWVIVIVGCYTLVNILLNYSMLGKNFKKNLQSFFLTEGILIFFIAVIAFIKVIC